MLPFVKQAVSELFISTLKCLMQDAPKTCTDFFSFITGKLSLVCKKKPWFPFSSEI